MDETQKDNSGLELEDILKEFGDFEMAVEPEDEDEDILLWGEELQEKHAVKSALPQDTVRLDTITREIKNRTQVPDQTICFTPVGQEEEPQQPEILLPSEPQTEPYSESWEPEYEQPIAEYVPPEPIVLRPKSRLHELKKKLIAGPEKRYYELVEKGLLKLQLAIIANGLVAIASVAVTGLFAAGIIPDDRIRLVVFVQFLGVLLSALFGSYQLMGGVADLFKPRFTLDTLLLFSLIASVADGIFCLQEVRVPCCSLFSLNMTMSLWSAYQRRNTEMAQMDTMRKATRLDSVVLQENYFYGKPGFLRGEGQVEDFMDTYDDPGRPEKVLNIYALSALVAAMGIGVAAGMLYDAVTGVRFFSASLLLAVPATAYITISRPTAILERRLHKLGTVICGWQGVLGLNARGAFPLTETDLFPSGSAKLNGLKFYGSRNPDQVIAYASAVVIADGGSMAPLFSQLLESRNGYHFEVETLRAYPNGGIGGVVNDEAVLVGSLTFMNEMGVEMPQGTKVNQAVYVAIDGVLNGVFAIFYKKMKSTAAGLATLCAYRSVTPVLTTCDFVLTESFLRSKFGIGTRRVLFLDREEREYLASQNPDEANEALALTTREGLAGIAYAVTGAKALRRACILGVTVHMMAGIIGLLTILALMIVRADYLLTPENLLMFALVWTIPGLLITEWTRII